MKVEESQDDVGAFLAVFAALLLDNALSLDETVSRVTDLVMASGKPSRDLVVALQSFDRLKQEFEGLGEALTRYAEATSSTPAGGDARAQLGQNVISAITVADLKERLLRRFQDETGEVSTPQLSPEILAQVNVDITF
ncbi:MAG TPA: hypothetical protein VK522_10965 [Pseudolabrys sp.]|nr:hypothetical protein [Pseudolabrys sp.]